MLAVRQGFAVSGKALVSKAALGFGATPSVDRQTKCNFVGRRPGSGGRPLRIAFASRRLAQRIGLLVCYRPAVRRFGARAFLTYTNSYPELVM